MEEHAVPTWDFHGRAAVVTGGNRGIGRAIAEALVAAGAEVHAFDVGAPDRDAPFICHEVDVSDAASVAAAVAKLPENTTLLVNNAGITRDRSLIKMSDEEWQVVLSVNLTGAFNTLRALAPRMRAAGHGRIVNITSINGLRGKFGQANYSAAKAGLVGLTKTAAKELGPKGVTVNAVAPGMVMTEMATTLPQEILDAALAETALKRLADPGDIAHTVLFLLSDAARMITGEVIKVDSGQYI
ncbi:MAG: dehydrogenase [Gammaproteobacteria bacterium]|nr:MAG: dehydrogenase [Gammaproteobacteria bacterium]